MYYVNTYTESDCTINPILSRFVIYERKENVEDLNYPKMVLCFFSIMIYILRLVTKE